MELTVEFIEKIEEEYLKILIKLLQNGDMDEDSARTNTREFLDMTPFKNSEDLETKIQSFTQAHPEFGGMYVDLLRYEDESKSQALLNQMRGHLKENRVDEALKLVQK